MEFNGHLEIKSTDLIIKERGLQDGGPVQKYIDNAVINEMKPYTPKISGILENAPTIGTVIGSGQIKQITPYARYLYYGLLMVSSITGSAYASKGEKKVLTDTPLQYSKAANPLAGKLWFERMKADKKEDILKEAQKVADRGGK